MHLCILLVGLMNEGGTLSATPVNGTISSTATSATGSINSTGAATPSEENTAGAITTKGTTASITTPLEVTTTVKVHACVCNNEIGICDEEWTKPGTWPNNTLTMCVFTPYWAQKDVTGIHSLDATYYETEKSACLAEWECPIGRCYRTNNVDQKCVEPLNARDLFNECYYDSVECLATLYRSNAVLIAPFVVDNQNQPGVVTKPLHHKYGVTMLPVSLTVPEAVLAAGKFFYFQGLAWVASKDESDPNARVLARFATRTRLRKPVVTEQPKVTQQSVVMTKHVIEVHKDDHHTLPVMPTQKTQKTQNAPAQTKKYTNTSLSWPQYSIGAITVVALWTTYCWVN